MWKPYLAVVAERAGQAVHVLDRFHIMSHYMDAFTGGKVELGESGTTGCSSISGLFVQAASLLARQVGEASAALADLRNDDLMRTQRVDQAQLAAAVTGTELALAQAQLAAYETARAARERYEAERARREALARWQADAVRARAEQAAFAAELTAVAGALIDSHRFVPSPSDW